MAGGFQQPERAGRITRKHDSYYPKTGSAGANVVTISESAPSSDVSVAYAAEELPKGYAVAVGPDGLLYKATPLFSDSKIAFFIASRTYASGEVVSLDQPERVTVPGASFTPGSALWLRVGTPNVSHSPLTVPSGTEDVIQHVAVAITTTDLLVQIGMPLIFE